MKKTIAALATILLAISAAAIPAKPGKHSYIQPDGSVVNLELHGDEFFSWTTIAGTTQAVELDKNGYWRNTTIDPSIRKAALQRRNQANERRLRKAGGQLRGSANPMTHGPRRIPVILVAFTDVDYSISDPRNKFDALLNQNGYSYNGGTGSVQDYYYDNSHGEFQPIFDVYGPVTLSHPMAYYGEQIKDALGRVIEQDARPEEALLEGCLLLDSQVDFSRYDYDNDGEVDMILYYYAGYNQAEWGPDESIWPHQGMADFTEDFDGKKIKRYFCTSELIDYFGATMCGIGTTCHEFGHSLGLPDFYDTDYEDNGECSALGYFSIMSAGSYLNDGRTPPYFNSEERIILGWMEEEDVPYLQSGDISFGPVQDNIAYRSETGTEGEYFIYECFDQTGWNTYLPGGLVIYHVDKSDYKLDSFTAQQHWDYWIYFNDINVHGDRPLFYIIPAFDQLNLAADSHEEDKWIFPGAMDVTEYTSIDWSGNSNLTISNISYSGGKVSFNSRYSADKVLIGKVTDMAGKALAGAKVVLTSVSAYASAPGRNLRKVPSTITSIETITEADGTFSMNIEEFREIKGHLTCSIDGYKTTGMDVNLSRRINEVQIKTRSMDQGDVVIYSYYDPTGDVYIYGDENYPASQAGAIRIPAYSIPEKGGILTNVSCQPIWEAEAYYIVVDAGDERLYTIPVSMTTEYFQTIDLSSHHLTIPAGKDIYVGFAYENAVIPYSGYEGIMFYITPTGNNCYTSPFSKTGSDWTIADGPYAIMMDVQIVETIDGGYPDMDSFLDLGICSIADPGKGNYKVGDSFPLNLALPQGMQAASVLWTLDGESVSEAVKLTSGSHIVSAFVTYADGSQEMLELKVEVK